MASWGEFAAAEPRFAAAVRARLDAGVHKTIATLRADGSPRVPRARKTLDLDEVVLVSLNDARDRLVSEHWHAGRDGVRRIERE